MTGGGGGRRCLRLDFILFLLVLFPSQIADRVVRPAVISSREEACREGNDEFSRAREVIGGRRQACNVHAARNDNASRATR